MFLEKNALVSLGVHDLFFLVPFECVFLSVASGDLENTHECRFGDWEIRGFGDSWIRGFGDSEIGRFECFF